MQHAYLEIHAMVITAGHQETSFGMYFTIQNNKSKNVIKKCTFQHIPIKLVLKRMSHAENMSESHIVVQKLEREHDFQRQAS